jgi:hypothetical protein
MIVLNDLKRREYELQAQLQQLKHQSIAQSKRMLALWQLKPRGSRIGQWVVQATHY